MRTVILSSLLLLVASVATANTNTSSGASRTTTVSSTRNLPVIVKNETLAPNLCRLHFDTGTTLDVRCKTNNQ